MLKNMNMRNEHEMRCEEFEMIGLDPLRDPSLSDETRHRASQHARRCSKCSSLAASWNAAQTELSAWAESTRDADALAVVENRLLQQFRLKHQSRRDRRTLQFATWALAAAAVMVISLSVWSWHHWRLAKAGNSPVSTASKPTPAEITNPTSTAPSTDSASLASASDNLMASNVSDGEFTQLLGSSTQVLEDAAIVRVGMPRSSLAALGIPVNEEQADDWIQVDLLVGSDGSPQAVRLPE
jgi:hypothetical protein